MMTIHTMTDTTPKKLRVIAAYLAQTLDTFPEEAPDDARVAFKFGTLIICCHASVSGVRAVA